MFALLRKLAPTLIASKQTISGHFDGYDSDFDLVELALELGIKVSPATYFGIQAWFEAKGQPGRYGDPVRCATHPDTVDCFRRTVDYHGDRQNFAEATKGKSAFAA